MEINVMENQTCPAVGVSGGFRMRACDSNTFCRSWQNHHKMLW